MIVFFVTFSLFFIEALLHYNYGNDDDSRLFHFPDTVTLLQIILTVGVFSLLNSRILKYLSKNYNIHQ